MTEQEIKDYMIQQGWREQSNKFSPPPLAYPIGMRRTVFPGEKKVYYEGCAPKTFESMDELRELLC